MFNSEKEYDDRVLYLEAREAELEDLINEGIARESNLMDRLSESEGTNEVLRKKLEDQVSINSSLSDRISASDIQSGPLLSLPSFLISDDERIDAVHPDHYDNGHGDVIEHLEGLFSKDAYEGFMVGNVIKYLERMNKKHNSPFEDIDKATYYIKRLREFEEKQVKQ